MYGTRGDEVQLPMDFQIADANVLSAPKFRKLFCRRSRPTPPTAGRSGSFPIMTRCASGSGTARLRKTMQQRLQIAKLMAVLALTPRGTYQMYYGEEIGMRTSEPKRKEDVRDPIGITGWPKEKGRDGERTPMQWTSAVPNAGFTAPNVTPWLPVPPSAAYGECRRPRARTQSQSLLQLLQASAAVAARPSPR